MPWDHEDHPLGEHTAVTTGSGRSGRGKEGGGGTPLLLLGAVLILAGAGMIVLPSVGPQYDRIVRGLAERGVTGFPVFAAGVLVCGLWLAVRTSRTYSLAAQDAAGVATPMIESLAEELVHLRDGLQGLRIEFVYLKDAVQTQTERLAGAPKASADTSADAMYRLAASLDQLGQRIDAQLNANQRELRESLAGLSTALQMVRAEEQGQRLLLGAGPTIEIESLGELQPEPERDPVPVEAHPPELQHPVDWHEDEEAPTEDRSRLGVLDLLDDLGRLLPRKTAIEHDRSAIYSDAFEGVRDEGWDHPDSPSAPLPARRTADDADGPGTLGGLLSAGDDETDDDVVDQKLEELRALLGDSRVRNALASMERPKD